MAVSKRRYWFKNRNSYGWYPATWEGWLSTFLYLTLIARKTIVVSKYSHSVDLIFWGILPYLVVYTVVFLVICFLTGESPRWFRLKLH